MDMHSIIDFVNNYPVCHFATVEGDQPRVRVFWTWFADHTGFYFHTPTNTPAYRQMLQNPYVEFCYYSPQPSANGMMIRISGKVEFLDSLDWKTILLEQRPFLRCLGTGLADDPILGPFRIPKGEVSFWKNPGPASKLVF